MLVTSKEDRARLDCKSLQQAVSTYYDRHNTFPKTLVELTGREIPEGMPYLEEKALIDPWGIPYNYDPNSRHQRTGMPLIYSSGPPGQNKRISNWD